MNICAFCQDKIKTNAVDFTVKGKKLHLSCAEKAIELAVSGNRYLVFTGCNYYPSGGWSDLEYACVKREAAESYVERRAIDWWHIVDLFTGEVVSTNRFHVTDIKTYAEKAKIYSGNKS